MASDRGRWQQRSLAGAIVDNTVRAFALIPYALIALALRLVMARVFFLSGQEKIEGPRVPLRIPYWDLEASITLPREVTNATLAQFEAQSANIPIPPEAAAYISSYAEFVLPICLLLGFATRFAALALVLLTMALQLYVSPQLWWSAHVYWICILAVLISLGPGAVSLDGLLRYLYRQEQASTGASSPSSLP